MLDLSAPLSVFRVVALPLGINVVIVLPYNVTAMLLHISVSLLISFICIFAYFRELKDLRNLENISNIAQNYQKTLGSYLQKG